MSGRPEVGTELTEPSGCSARWHRRLDKGVSFQILPVLRSVEQQGDFWRSYVGMNAQLVIFVIDVVPQGSPG